MSYEQLIETVSLIVENPKINKVGLTLIYELDTDNHLKMNELLFKKSNSFAVTFTPSDEFEVVMGGILIKFLKILK